nr:TMV resistance protein N-like [Ipomoea batatas]
MNFCKNIEVLPKLHHTVEKVYLDHCHSLKMIQELPPRLRDFSLNACQNLEILPELPPNLSRIILNGCRNLKMLPKLPPHLEILSLHGCGFLQILPQLPPNLRDIRLNGCSNLKMLPKFPNNLHIRSSMMLGGVPHIDFSESIKEVLLGSRVGYVDFECSLTCNEIPSWIRCKEEGASLSFQLPIDEAKTLEFVGLIFWVVVKPRAFPGLSCDYFVSIESETGAFEMNNLLSFNVQLEMEEISILHFIPRYHFEDIKAGEVIKVIPITMIRVEGFPTSIEACMVKKIGAEALYTDTYGVRQFVPLMKPRSL